MPHAELVQSLLAWFEQNRRDLPWRRTREPYAVWISEVMLQQTQVSTVIPYWERWMAELPDIGSLARARPERLRKLWEGLGYYSRLRNLQEAARLIIRQHNGQFPTRFEEVYELPGIGRYTAGAICSIAFHQPFPVLDGNVTRVLCRLFGIRSDPRAPATNRKLWDLAQQLVREAALAAPACQSDGPRQGGIHPVSALNQSLMELGAVVCTARQPRCPQCPLSANCVARARDQATSLPRRRAGPRATPRHFMAFIFESKRRFFVRQRPADGINAGFWEFPSVEVRKADADPGMICRQVLGRPPAKCKKLCCVKHSITRFRITLEAFEVVAGSFDKLTTPGRWLAVSSLHQLPLTSAHKKVLGFLESARAPHAPSIQG